MVYRPSSFSLRSVGGTSLRERQRARRGIVHVAKPKPTQHVVVIYLNEEIHAALAKAATAKSLSAETLAAHLVGGIVTRGSLVETLRLWADYLSDVREQYQKKKAARLKQRKLSNGEALALIQRRA